MNLTDQHFHFVTGRLAEPAVRHVVAQTAKDFGFDYSISVLPITVAALMTPKWLLRHLQVPAKATQVVLPGHLQREVESIQRDVQHPVMCGPRDIRDLAVFFGGERRRGDDYGEFAIEILAEINHADRLSPNELLATAQELVAAGADVVDLGCSPGHLWKEVGDAVHSLRDLGFRVSIDSFDPQEVTAACAAGAELVLSVNSSNRQAASDWGCEVVAIPDSPDDLASLHETAEFLLAKHVPMRLDPILEPLGCGFAHSLMRYHACRQRYPCTAMMMGIGNITELTDSDSAGLNLVLLSLCEELQIHSVLTTQVINWARSSVRECDLARRLVHYSQKHGIPPKHIEPQLVLLRDPRVHEFPDEVLDGLAETIRDKNIRVFNGRGKIHLVTSGVHISAHDPFEALQKLLASPVGDTIDREHAFYLGFELSKALTANTLGKQYDQDRALNWGFLTREE